MNKYLRKAVTVLFASLFLIFCFHIEKTEAAIKDYAATFNSLSSTGQVFIRLNCLSYGGDPSFANPHRTEICRTGYNTFMLRNVELHPYYWEYDEIFTSGNFYLDPTKRYIVMAYVDYGGSNYTYKVFDPDSIPIDYNWYPFISREIYYNGSQFFTYEEFTFRMYENRSPVIDSVNVSYNKNADRIEFTIYAYDPDNDSINYKVMVNGQTSWQNTTSSNYINTTGWPEGNYTVQFWAEDTHEYVTTSKVVSIIRNKQPDLNVSLPSENSYFSKNEGYNNIQISGTVSDEDITDLITVKYTLQNKAIGSDLAAHSNIEIVSNKPSDGLYHAFNFTIYIDETIPEGSYTLKLWAEDDKGASSILYASNLFVDNTPPFLGAPSTSAGTAQIYISPSATDALSGLHTVPYRYNRNGEDLADWESGNLVDTGLNPNNRYTYKYKARDAVGNESEYSDPVSIYTLARDPQAVQVVSAKSDQVDLKIVHDELNGEVPEAYVEIRLKANGMVVAYSDWSADIERTLAGLSANTEYEIWAKVRNGDGVENEFVKVLESFYSNRSPEGLIVEPSENHSISEDGILIVSGKVWDKDKDILNVSVEIGGIVKVIELTDIPHEEPGKANWLITFNGDELSEGTHSIKVRIIDSKGTEIEIPESYNITVDKTPPIVSAPLAVAESTMQIIVTAEAEDSGTGLHTEPYFFNRNGEDIGQWTAVSLVDDGLYPNTRYSYKVKAKDAVGNVSDYSPEVRRYTLALDPVEISTISTASDTITVYIINNPLNGEVPETYLELRSKADGIVVASSDWSTNTERVITGLALDTEYELWLKTRNGDGVENDYVLVQDSQFSNRLHFASISMPNEDTMITEVPEQNTFVITGKVWDLDQDELTIFIKIGDVEKSLTINDTPASKPSEDNWSISFSGDDLPNGTYENISIRIRDNKGEEITLPFNYSLVVAVPRIVRIEVEPAEINVPVGQIQELNVIAYYSNGITETAKKITELVSWTISDPEVASIKNGEIIGFKKGVVSIRAHFNEFSNSTLVKVTDPVIVKIDIYPERSVAVGNAFTLTAIAYYSDGSEKDITQLALWSSDNPTIATVNKGTVTGVSVGSATIQVEHEGAIGTILVQVTERNVSSPSSGSSSPTLQPPAKPDESLKPESSSSRSPKPDSSPPESWFTPITPQVPKPNTEPISYKSNPVILQSETFSKVMDEKQEKLWPDAKNSSSTDNLSTNPLFNLPSRTKEIGVVRGYVKDNMGNPIADARIELHSKPKVTYTDKNGFFQFENVEMGLHKIYLADERISKDLILLNSITVKEGDKIIAIKGNQVALNDSGALETAQIQISSDDTVKELEIVVGLDSNKNIAKFRIMSLLYDNLVAKAAISGGIGVILCLFVGLAFFHFGTNTSVFVGPRRISIRRVKLTKEGVILDLTKEFMKADGNDLMVVFSMSLSKRISGKYIDILENGNRVAKLIAPEFSGEPLVLEVETPGI